MSIVLGEDYLGEIFGGKFEVISSGFLDGQYNMDFDYGRAMALAEGKALPMLRFYGWNPWTLSLGYNQAEDSIDKTGLAQRGWGIVRRPTGGRAVLHADELTYSVVVNIGNDRTALDLYRDIHKFLLTGLKELPESADVAEELGFEKSQHDFKDFYRQSGFSVSCFASSARYEIAFQGRKVVGSAQRVFGGVLLQHGSILLGSGHEQLAQIANTESTDKKKALEKYITGHSVSLTEVCGRKISYDECLDKILAQIGIVNNNFDTADSL